MKNLDARLDRIAARVPPVEEPDDPEALDARLTALHGGPPPEGEATAEDLRAFKAELLAAIGEDDDA